MRKSEALAILLDHLFTPFCFHGLHILQPALKLRRFFLLWCMTAYYFSGLS